MAESRPAPGYPGGDLSWTSAAKEAVGTGADPLARIWFTICKGILTEIYYPRVDQACVRDSGLIVTDGRSLFSPEPLETEHHLERLVDGIPAYRLVNTCKQGRYRVEKQILVAPFRSAIVQSIVFENLGDVPLQLYAWLTPRIGKPDENRQARCWSYQGIPMLVARHDQTALALACSCPWLACSVGYVGESDGWTCLRRDKQLRETYTDADGGNASLTGQLDWPGCAGRFTLAIGCGTDFDEAADQALHALQRPFDELLEEHCDGWNRWLSGLEPLDRQTGGELFAPSAVAIRTHADKSTPGGIVASLSVPWGISRDERESMGYQLVWVRDLVRAAIALLAAGHTSEFWHVLDHLRSTQRADGHWPQNMYLDGRAHSHGRQMDETASPVLLVDAAIRSGLSHANQVRAYWPMIRGAVAYILARGPATEQDRWETSPGYSPYTLAVEIAALLAAAELADSYADHSFAGLLRETADTWNDSIDRWTYATGTKLARAVGVDGYYVRLGPAAEGGEHAGLATDVKIQNRPPGQDRIRAEDVVSPDVLALVRYGLRAPDDARIVDSVKVLDACMKVDTPFGPAWHRYTMDGYGEHEDGAPYDGTGIGRAWPLLTGERAHYELAEGHREQAVALMQTMERFAGPCGLIPEQVWDSADIPDRGLYFGRPTGSAMPLVWAHAEYITLLRSIRDGRVFDQPTHTVNRYLRRAHARRRSDR